MGRLDGRVCIITGGASGIGKSIAMIMGAEGARIVACDVNMNGIKEVVDQVKIAGGEAVACEVDISKKEQVKTSIEKALNEFGKIDVLVNCAAYLAETAGGPFHEESETEWDMHINITLKGTLNYCKAVIPHMMDQKSGRIINITSAAVKGIQPGGPYLYPACKAAIATVSRNLAVELARYGILVNCVAPGPIKTAKLLSQPKEFVEKIARPIPLKRLGEPEDVANLVLFLASNESGYITGQQYSVDGGLVMV